MSSYDDASSSRRSVTASASWPARRTLETLCQQFRKGVPSAAPFQPQQDALQGLAGV